VVDDIAFEVGSGALELPQHHVAVVQTWTERLDQRG
jgi:hypothetical protein